MKTRENYILLAIAALLLQTTAVSSAAGAEGNITARKAKAQERFRSATPEEKAEMDKERAMVRSINPDERRAKIQEKRGAASAAPGKKAGASSAK